MSQEPIYIQLSPEVRELLSKENVDLEGRIKAELKKDGVDATVRWDKNPTSAEPDRELVLLILATGAAVTMVGTAIARIIDAHARNAVATTKERHLTIAKDDKGQPIRDRDKNPVYNVIEKPGVPPQGETSRATVRAGTLLQFELASGAAARR